ncbi:MAG: hypothetical protein MdMp014T_0404 [Treponematales bacterium]
MASAPSSFYVNRDTYLAALDASRRAEEQSGEITGAAAPRPGGTPASASGLFAPVWSRQVQAGGGPPPV